MMSQSSFSFKKIFMICAMMVISIVSASAQKTASLPEQPGIYRMQLGDFDVIAISDGTIPLNLHTLLHDAKPGELDDLLHRSFLDSIVETSLTAFLVRANNKLILIDAKPGISFNRVLKLSSESCIIALSSKASINSFEGVPVTRLTRSLTQ